MTLGGAIKKIRTAVNMSQEQFANLFGVSQQSVQKWENGDSLPELGKIVKISKYFGVSLDSLILGNDGRAVEEMQAVKEIKPLYSNIHPWEMYPTDVMTEYRQCIEEGLDVESYREIFEAISRLPSSEVKKKFGDIVFEIVINSGVRNEYKYTEPSDLESIKALRKSYSYQKHNEMSDERQISGAWYGRICGCMLGKSVEGVKTHEFVPFLKDIGNYPMHRYIYSTDLTDEICDKYAYHFKTCVYVDQSDGMPIDDDTNYTVLYQEAIEKYGRDFTPYDISRIWLDLQKKDAYCTAERVAYCNFVKGFVPPQSAVYKNPYREWIGAQIRGDYFGYINPGNPALAAEMAWRDASVSHVKNGIYGEMFVAAMIAVAATTNNIEDIIRAGLAEIPCTSRLYEKITDILNDWKNGVSKEDAFAKIHETYDEKVQHDWCHTISNASVVVASLLYGKGDYGKSICMAVETGFDTDCNGATVGSILGMANGVDGIPKYWTESINDTLHTSIFGVGSVKISDRVKMTMKHM